MLKVEFNKKSTNPFYGLKNCLEMYQTASKGNVNPSQLNACWAEVQNDKEKREMFFALLFSIGDITARKHNIFRNNKVDSGGSAQRNAFLTILQWLRTANYTQYRKFLFAHLFNEFVSFDSILANRIQTVKKKSKIPAISGIKASLSGTPEYLNDLSDFVVSIIKGTNPSEKYFLAKFLTRPRLSKRKGHKKMLPETRQIMKAKEAFLKEVSDKAGLQYKTRGTHIEFTGYINWRKEYIGELESVLFSSGKVKEFDKQEFLGWLDKLPASARFRVRKRLLDKDNKVKGTKEGQEGKSTVLPPKWGDLAAWFLEWEKFKENKQGEQRVLEEKVRQGTASQDDEAKLVKVKKEAKVTVGAVEFAQLYVDIVMGNVDKLKIQPFLDKVNLPYNTLVFADDSGSMAQYKVDGVTAFDFAMFMATIVLTKNPDDTGRSLMGLFSDDCRLYSTMHLRSQMTNSIFRPNTKAVNEPLIDPNQHFLDNLKRIREFGTAMRTSNGTNIASIPDRLYASLQNDSQMIETLQSFPVWTIISDGNWNNMHSPEASIADMMKRCEMYFGFRPFVIAIDVANNTSANIHRFSGIDNFMFIPPNPAQIEQLLTNFKDIDMLDVYTPLQSLYRSNRYDLVKKNVI